MIRQRRCLIFGASGQDGSLLCEELLARGEYVIAVTASRSRSRLEALLGRVLVSSTNIQIVDTDYTLTSVSNIFMHWDPNVVIKCSGQSYVSKSWRLGETTADSQYRFTALILDMIEVYANKGIRFIDLGSAEMYGNSCSPGSFLDEDSSIEPYNPYGCAKSASYKLTKIYRELKGHNCGTAILFPHESNRRGKDFATMKFARQLVNIKLGESSYMNVGNLDIIRDWSSARDIVKGIILMADADKSDDYILCSGRGLSIRTVIEIMAHSLGLKNIFDKIIEDKALMRQEDPLRVVGNPIKANTVLGWNATETAEEFLGEIAQSQLIRVLGSK